MSHHDIKIPIIVSLALILAGCMAGPPIESSMKIKTAAETESPNIEMKNGVSQCYAMDKVFYFTGINSKKEEGHIADFGEAFGEDIRYEKKIGYAKMVWDEATKTVALLFFSPDRKFLLRLDFPHSQILECGLARTVIFTHQTLEGMITHFEYSTDTNVTFSDAGEYTHVDTIIDQSGQPSRHLESNGDLKMLD